MCNVMPLNHPATAANRNLDRLTLALDDLLDLPLNFRIAIVQRPSASAHLFFAHARNISQERERRNRLFGFCAVRCRLSTACCLWSGRRDLNSRRLAPRASASTWLGYTRFLLLRFQRRLWNPSRAKQLFQFCQRQLAPPSRLPVGIDIGHVKKDQIHDLRDSTIAIRYTMRRG